MDKRISVILEEFDFEKASRVYAFLGWKWKTLDPIGVPDAEDLRNLAEELLGKAALEPDWCRVSTGGLRATHDHGNLILEFVAVEAEADEESVS